MANKPEDYKYIEAWGVYMRSFDYYIRGEQRIAFETNAPLDAIYRNSDNKWVTFSEITNEATKTAVELLHQHVVNNTIALKKVKLENHGYVMTQDEDGDFIIQEADDSDGFCMSGNNAADLIELAYKEIFESPEGD